MSQSYQHGVYGSELPTSLLPARNVPTNVLFVVGTAPVQTLAADKPRYINDLRLYYSRAEFVAEMGWPEASTTAEFKKYTLCAAADVHFSKYNAAPMMCVNVFDPKKHMDGDKPDPGKVTTADIIGGIDADTLKPTGLECISEAFPRYRLVPGCILVPGFDKDPAVGVVMGAKTININGLFECEAITDIDVEAVSKYTDVPGYKNENNLVAERLIVTWPKVALGDVVYPLSLHLAGGISVTDGNTPTGTPHVSPSNKQAQITRAIGAGGKEIWLGRDQNNYLNGEGIVTVDNFDGGWRFWGNRTAAYPTNTDPKDAFIPIRRFFNWYKNTFILTYFQKVDSPITRRLIQTILDSEQHRLDGFTAQEVILGGRIAFQDFENPTVDIMDGLMRFHLWITPPPPARAIYGIFEFDPNYISTLFG
ncbi:MAG: phage tail sheath family protein [Deltaproteobacteria bacterium]|jgi:phage tail sheath protein FI|nr:phage tail sheath family protein [Deltaproteobacteria bacterium]